MLFNSKLLSTEELSNLQYKSSIKGSYSTMQFVLRLNENVRYNLNESTEFDSDKKQAFSTYLHETIHWWQHIGSNFGFILNTSFPALAVESISPLNNIIKQGIKVKPILDYEKSYFEENGSADIADVNIIVNNFYDIEYAKLFCLDNKTIMDIADDRRFFLSMGHCFNILWTNALHVYKDTIDHDFKFIPNYDNWVNEFKNLEHKKVDGFYPDSKLHYAPLGIRQIFEGQAVFNQIVYLKNAFKENNIIFKDFIDQGILHGIYLEAFDHFLRILNEERPIFVEDSLISLFLLSCDLSINPTNGFPLDIYDFRGFINKNNPGLRFISICSFISKKKTYFLEKCKIPSKETYIELSKMISEALGYKCPYQSLSVYTEWLKNDSIKELLKEEENHKYKTENMPFRLFLAKFIKIQLDKKDFPEVFCWIGHYMSTPNNNYVKILFENHKALFTDAEDGEIKPIIREKISEENLLETFNQFYLNTMLFELILKWISEDGEFKFDYKWLMNERNEEIIPRLKEEFKRMFGIEIDEISHLHCNQ
ncbi:hypothetical protein [Sphingobacterium sp. JUb56]|uniref:hypothetical protein n=1 Tax=Sphingobacterium sp. JUb56 TaxID=2587145 RepID=UPI0016168A45|nr:hypothetical protein [Sphingobacterium sp. JUb56]MBB2951579.1 hypothetical protein [Sphingobacterium sp. JUb56]